MLLCRTGYTCYLYFVPVAGECVGLNEHAAVELLIKLRLEGSEVELASAVFIEGL